MQFSSLNPSAAPGLEPPEVAVLHTLMYFDIFRHPLRTDEIHHNCQWTEITLTETASALENLQSAGIASEEDGFWFLSGNQRNVSLRLDRQNRALFFQKKAKKYSSFISKFPFVRAVCVSGSLSKGTMDKNGDIDYFIITEPGRLWVARTFLILFKKLFLFNSKKYFCVNYFIDSNRLSIPDRNLFVATEIAFLQPMVNEEIYSEFIRENNWVKLFYPNREIHSRTEIKKMRSPFIKRLSEKVLNKKAGDWLDERFLRITLSRWKKKFPHLSDMEFDIDFRSKKNVSKHHPQGFQRKVSNELEKRRNLIFEQSGITVPAMKWEWSSENTDLRLET